LVVQIDLSVIYILICFLLVFWVARRFLFQRLDRIIEQRNEQIESARQLAENTDAKVAKAIAGYDGSVSEARAKAFELRQQLKGEASEREKQIVEEARSAASERIKGAQGDLDRKVEEYRIPLAAEGARLAESIAELVLRRRS